MSNLDLAFDVMHRYSVIEAPDGAQSLDIDPELIEWLDQYMPGQYHFIQKDHPGIAVARGINCPGTWLPCDESTYVQFHNPKSAILYKLVWWENQE